MGVFRFLFQASSPRKTPISALRRKVWLEGVEYSVKLLPGDRNFVLIDGSVLRFTLKEMTRENFELYFQSWYRRISRKIFQESIDQWRETMERMGYFVDAPRIKVFDMRKAWGRCYYTKGLITLNAHLAKTPRACIDYITLHELCHFLINAHNADFYGIMTRIDPQWRDSEADLKEFARQTGLTR